MIRLTKKAISFLRVSTHGPKNTAWVTANGHVVWSTDGHNLFAVGGKAHIADTPSKRKLSALFFGDLSKVAGKYRGHQLNIQVHPAEYTLDQDYKDPTELLTNLPANRFTFDKPAELVETLRKSDYLRWADHLRFSPIGNMCYQIGYHSPLNRNMPCYPHDSFYGVAVKHTASEEANWGKSKKGDFDLPVPPVRKIINNMNVERVTSVGTSYRDPVYFYGRVDDFDAVAIVSPVK